MSDSNGNLWKVCGVMSALGSVAMADKVRKWHQTAIKAWVYLAGLAGAPPGVERHTP